MEKRDVLLIVNYWHFETEKASSRYRSLANVLCEEFDLEVVTSTFCHLTKKQREPEKLGLDRLPYKMTLQYEKGYRKNISLDRIASYTQFGKNVDRYLRSRKKPDLIIVSVPSLAVADYVTRYAKEQSIPVIVDIQDLWPEAFKMALDIPVVSDVLFYPMKKQAQRIYSRADVIMAVSDTYAAVGKRSNPIAGELSIYIGTDGELVQEKTAGVEVGKPSGEFWIGYVGALGHSYDIKAVVDAVKKLHDAGHHDIVLKVMGEGVLRTEFEEYAGAAGIRCDFTGLLDYGTMMKTLMQCDIAVNPIVGKSVSSIINKVADYAAAGVPVVNTQNSPEYRKLLEEHNAGINVENGNTEQLAQALLRLHEDDALRAEMGARQKALFDERFDRNKTYPAVIHQIHTLLDS